MSKIVSITCLPKKFNKCISCPVVICPEMWEFTSSSAIRSACLNFSNLRVICKKKMSISRHLLLKKICDVAPLALQMLLSCPSRVFVQVRGHAWECDSVVTLISKTVFMSQSFLMRFRHRLDFSKNLASAIDCVIIILSSSFLSQEKYAYVFAWDFSCLGCLK